MLQKTWTLVAAACVVLTSASLHAQNTSTVFSPEVREGASEVEYRIAIDPDRDAVAQRIHYQYGITEAWRLRGIFQFSGNEVDDMDFSYFRAEAQWQFLKKTDDGLASAVRFEFQVPNGDLPFRVRVAPTTQWTIDENWYLRGNVLLGKEFGQNSDSGFGLEGRAEIAYKIDKTFTLAVDYFADFNDTNNLLSFNDIEHQLGPLLKVQASENWRGYAGALWGLNNAAPNVELRFMLSYSF